MSTQNMQLGKVTVLVADKNVGGDATVKSPPIKNAWVALKRRPSSGNSGQTRQKAKQEAAEEHIEEFPCEEKVYKQESNENGCATFEVPYGVYDVYCEAFGISSERQNPIRVDEEDSCLTRQIIVPLLFDIDWGVLTDDCNGTEFNQCVQADAGSTWVFKAYHAPKITTENRKIKWATSGGHFYESDSALDTIHLNTQGHVGKISISATMSEIGSASVTREMSIFAKQPRITNMDGNLNVALKRTETSFTEDTAFWTGIRNSTEALSFNNYFRFMEWIFCGGNPPNPDNGFEDQRFFYQARGI